MHYIQPPRVVAVILAMVSAASGVAMAEVPSGQRVVPAGSQASLAAPSSNFNGSARVDPLTKANADINASSAYVTFEPGVHSNWHTHPKGQYLIVTSGVGITQEWGKPVREIHPGDVVWCPPGVKHWHGAAPKTAMTHLAITGVDNGKSVEWMEPVSDQKPSTSQ